ncbi:helix-turn-helix transcriptional regulator [Humibacillus xanthopallidus]|uniref:Homeodomain-like domain-containing protein n=1 Tax=Humibacillus xanthopallidus TaxID=412689 RepID=A0A543I2B0_9MICO|nr:LuxR family transcriptional regulator [Humibacillus xanthopallidus]TQM64726.1 Homeodomain-like domain-containing protein [Humibacillus xanthopallidus]
MLEVFGIQSVTESVYRSMLERPSADTTEIARIVGISVPQVKAELDLLADLMLVEVGAGTRPFQAIPPEQAIAVLIGREEARLAERQRQVSEAREDLTALVESFVTSRTQTDTQGRVEVIDDPRVVTSRLFQLTQGAHERVSFMLPGHALPPAAIAPSARLDDELLARGIPLRVVVTDASLDTPHWRDHLARQVVLGVQARSHPAPPHRMVIVDGDVAILPRDESSGALVVHGCDLVAPTAALFDEIWQAAIPLVPDTAGAPEGEFSDARVRQVVALLAQGQKDEAIARRLNVSVRTVRRLVSAALSALHAESRFEAGVLAVKRGWVV